MNQLIIINQNGKLYADSREIADRAAIRHDNLVAKVKTYLEVIRKDPSLKLRAADFFVESTYQDKQNQERPCFLVTRKGCDMIANKMTGEKGILFSAEYVTKFEEMEQQLTNPYQNLSTEMKALLMHDEKLVVIDNRVSKLENEMTIDYGQKKALRDIGNKRVMEELGGKHTMAYKHFSKTAFSEIWKHYKNCMNINSYENTPVKEFERGKEILRAWQPSKELGYAIIGANTQSAAVAVN